MQNVLVRNTLQVRAVALSLSTTVGRSDKEFLFVSQSKLRVYRKQTLVFFSLHFGETKSKFWLNMKFCILLISVLVSFNLAIGMEDGGDANRRGI